MFVVHKNSPLPFRTFECTSHPRKSDSPPVSELGSLPLTDIAMTPSTSSRPSRPRSAMAPSRRTASAGAAAASASASASARPQSAASSSQLRLQSQGAPGIWSRYEMINVYNFYNDILITLTLTAHNWVPGQWLPNSNLPKTFPPAQRV